MPIHHTFGPHATASSCLQAKMLIAQPWQWKNGKQVDVLRAALKKQFDGDVSLFASGREALLAILKAMNLQTGEEVIIQGYTCGVVPNAIHAAKGVPVYADINRDTLNIAVENVEQLISNRTRAVICQHTFGIPADTAALRQLCDEYNILLIEDCAHVMPDDIGPSTIGNDGDIMFFSFGRDKAISGITGGAVVSKNDGVTSKLQNLEAKAAHLPALTIFCLLWYPCLYVAARPVYGIGLGKALLLIARKLGLLMAYVTDNEKKGHMSPLLHKLPNACAALAHTQHQKLKKINEHRRTLTHLYLDAAKKKDWSYPKNISPDLPLQKFPIFIEHADDVRSSLKKKNIHLEDGWTGAVVCPRSTDQTAANYERGTCPVAEEVAATIMTLPTHPATAERQAYTLISYL